MNAAFPYLSQLNNPDWSVVKGFMSDGLQSTFTNIQVGYETEHNTDDTHGDVTADSLIVRGLTTLQSGLSANGKMGTAGQVLTAGGNTANAYWSSALGNTTITGTLTANGPFVLSATLSANGSTGTLYQVLSSNSAANAYWSGGRSGTWTPVDASGDSLTFTSVNATYLRLGGLVFVNVNLTYPSTVSATSALIGGLPFAEASGEYTALAVGVSTVAGIGALIVQSSNTVELFVSGSGTRATNAALSLGTLYFSGVYRAA